MTAGTDDAEGVGNWRKALEALDLTCPVLIENTAGGNHSMARTPDALARLWDTVAPFGVGFCLDTCHAWAGGIPLPEGVDLLRSITGRIDVVHANDSVGALDSGRDRHANFGKGTLGTAAFWTPSSPHARRRSSVRPAGRHRRRHRAGARTPRRTRRVGWGVIARRSRSTTLG